MSLVWDRSEASSTHLLVMLAIADFADDDGFAWPSHERIGLKIRQTERNAKRIVKQLLDTDELTLDERGTFGRSNQYRINVEALEAKAPRMSPLEGAQRDIQGTPQRDIQGNQEGQHMSPEPSTEPSEGNRQESQLPTDGGQLFATPGSPEVQDEEPEVQEIWDYYMALFGDARRVKTLTPQRRGMIRKGLAAVGGDASILKRAFDGLKSYREGHPHGSQDTSIDTVLKTKPGGSNLTDQIEWWAGQATATASVDASISPVWRDVVTEKKNAVREWQMYHILRPPVSEHYAEQGRRAAAYLEDNFGITYEVDDQARITWSAPTKLPEKRT